jgi:hypothetical protein
VTGDAPYFHVERLSRAAWREAPRFYSVSTEIRAAVSAQRCALSGSGDPLHMKESAPPYKRRLYSVITKSGHWSEFSVYQTYIMDILNGQTEVAGLERAGLGAESPKFVLGVAILQV